MAKSVGFDRPILHGLCTYGITCRAVMEVFLGFDPAPIASHAARFSAPVLPGETLLIELWKDGLEVSFQAKAKERDVIVIKNGRTVLNA
jgi:acyl dehydratase